MRSYLSMIPTSAKVHKRQNAMTIWCIVIAVFLVTAVFSMTEMAVRQETNRLVTRHGIEEVTSLFTSEAFLSLLPIAALLFLFVLCAGVFMVAGSMNSNVAQRTQLFGMMRCIGMSKKQVTRYVRLEALNWCKTAVPMGLVSGTVVTWVLCAVLKYVVGGEWSDMPQLGLSILGIISGAVVGILTVLIVAYVAGVIPELVKGVMLEDPPFFNVQPGEFENTFVYHDGFKVVHDFLNQTGEFFMRLLIR